MGTSTQYTSVRKKNERSKQKQRRQRLNGLVQNRNQRKQKNKDDSLNDFVIGKIANTDFNGVEYFVQISQTKIFVSWATFPTHFLAQILGGFFQLEIFRIQKF